VSFFYLWTRCSTAIFSLSPVVGTPIHRFSRPVPTFEAHDSHDLAPGSSLDGLKIVEDLPWLMDQSPPPSLIEFRSGSPTPPSEEVISRVRARKAAAAAQNDQVSGSTRDPQIVSAGTSEVGDLYVTRKDR
jgi:hypothetical protein